MSDEFKARVAQMKAFFGVSSLADVAEKLGRARTSANNWFARKEIPHKAYARFLKLSSAHGGLTASTPPPPASAWICVIRSGFARVCSHF